MRKEVVFAIVIGLILGAIILFGFQIANQSAKEAQNTASESSRIVTTAPTPTATKSNLIINEPLDHAVVAVNTIKISGQTLPGSSLAIQSDADDALVTADTSGNFTTDFKLTGGDNLIKITALLPDQRTESAEISIIYTTAKIN